MENEGCMPQVTTKDHLIEIHNKLMAQEEALCAIFRLIQRSFNTPKSDCPEPESCEPTLNDTLMGIETVINRHNQALNEIRLMVETLGSTKLV